MATYKLVVAEKPSVAGEIANVIGARSRQREYFEGGGWRVTWLYGHLLEIYVREADEGQWTRSGLPIIPEGDQWEMRPIQEQTREGQRPRHEVVASLFRDPQCTEIVVATDAGREGELIFRNLYYYSGSSKPFRRLWISSLTEAAIREGFDNLRPGSEFDNLYLAARQRERADWLVGINATRAFTIAVNPEGGRRTVLSLGRVQTPTLCLICLRYLENRNFQKVKFWMLRGQGVKDGEQFRWRNAGRFDTREAAEAARLVVDGVGYLTVTKVDTQRVTENPPLLHDLGSLQKSANSRYGLTLEETLEIAQSLYERKLISYPRTGSRYIPEDVYARMPALLRKAAFHPTYGAMADRLACEKLNRRSVNDNKITDHHALIITGNEPRGLDEMEQNVYDLILQRMVEAFSPVCVADITKVEFECGDCVFETRGRKDVSAGWRAVGRGDEDVELDSVDEVELSMRPLPQMFEGERISVNEVEVIEDETKPKPLYSDATLLSAMENAGRQSDDRNVAEALKDIGIGTPATRAETVETLVRRKYIFRNSRKRLIPTDRGLLVFGSVRSMAIANVELTARWEMALGDIADGERDADGFEESIRRFTRRITADILNANSFDNLRKALLADMIVCPKCGETMVLAEKCVFCGSGSCDARTWRYIAGKRLSDESMRRLIKTGETGFLKGFKGRNGEFEANVKLNGDMSTTLEFKRRK